MWKYWSHAPCLRRFKHIPPSLPLLFPVRYCSDVSPIKVLYISEKWGKHRSNIGREAKLVHSGYIQVKVFEALKKIPGIILKSIYKSVIFDV